MEKIDLPEFATEMGIASCESAIRSHSLRERYRESLGHLISLANNYVELARLGRLHQINPLARTGLTVGSSEMIDMYTSRFARKATPGRQYYDLILNSAARGRCPYCGIKPASTVDHLLPKSIYAQFAVTRENLVPACRDCNTRKVERLAQNAREVYLHPYFDDIGSVSWLELSLRATRPVGFSYAIDRSCGLEGDLLDRLEFEFLELQLAQEYAFRAGEELAETDEHLVNLRRRFGRAALVEHLSELANSVQGRPASMWKYVLFQTLSQSGWFVDVYCDG
jgi:hypothetical protein